MNRMTQIRTAVVQALEHASIKKPETIVFDGLPAMIDEDNELPAIAVHLSGRTEDDEYLDEIRWRITLHVTAFLKRGAPDAALDELASEWIIPTVEGCVVLRSLCTSIEQTECDYVRAEAGASWTAIDIQYDIVYEEE